jgi:integrase/recombinase XerD
MKTYKDYLLQRNYRSFSILHQERFARRFLEWMKKENLEPKELTYSDLLSLVKHYRDQGFKPHNINGHLVGVQNYLDYLLQQGKINYNPAINLRIRGMVDKLPGHLLNREQLESIYESYEPKTPVQKRNKIIIGLIVYQALKREDLHGLEPKDINLQKGTVCLRKNIKLKARTLKLAANQILPLQEYIEKVRPELLKLKKQSTKDYKTDKLLLTIGESHHIMEALRELSTILRKKHPYMQNYVQLRSSRISLWLKEKNIREVQYMAGHGCVYSTEKYIRANLDELKEQLGKYHPLNKETKSEY